MWLRWRLLKKTGRRHAYLAWRDENGRESSKPLRTTDPVVAEALLREARRAAGEVEARPTGAPAQLLEDFLAEKSLQVRPGTVQQYREKLTPLFAAWSGTPMHLWKRALWIDYVKAHPAWAPRTAEIVYQKASGFIDWAQALDIPIPNFLAGYKPPRPRPQEADFLTADEEAAVMAEAQGHYLEAPIALAMYAGLSRADFRELDWSAVDLDAGTIRRPRSKSGQLMVIPIPPPLEAVLRRVRALGGPVCRGLPKSNASLHKALHRCLDRAKVRRGGWHRFRHTYATRLVAAGADVAVVRKLLGQAPGSSSAWRYFHPDKDREEDAVSKAFGE